MNVLLTCAGRRNYLVRYFEEALGARGHVFVCDSSPHAPAVAAATRSFLVPPVDHPEYFDALLSACRQHEVRLLISLNDLELHRLAERAEEFRAAGVVPLISAPTVTEVCQDKWATFAFLGRQALDTPETYATLADATTALTRGEIRFPLLVKPRWGSGSLGVELVENAHELELAYEWTLRKTKRSILAKMCHIDVERMLLIQQHVAGQEYGLDVVNDLNGRHVATFVKRKLSMRSGETDRAVTVHDERLEVLGRTLAERLKHIGNLDCDVVVNERGCYVLDLNPRFGGGYPFSHVAGANLPAAFIAWVDNSPINSAWLKVRPGVAAVKFDSLAIVKL